MNYYDIRALIERLDFLCFFFALERSKSVELAVVWPVYKRKVCCHK